MVRTHSSPGATFPPLLTEAGGGEYKSSLWSSVQIQITLHPRLFNSRCKLRVVAPKPALKPGKLSLITLTDFYFIGHKSDSPCSLSTFMWQCYKIHIYKILLIKLINKRKIDKIDLCLLRSHTFWPKA